MAAAGEGSTGALRAGLVVAGITALGAFGPALGDQRIATVGGLFLAQLGRLVRAGDEVTVANVRLVAERVEAGLVESAILDLVEEES